MQIRSNHNHTLYASYIGYITQAIINNFAPLLFLTFHSSYNIPLEMITLLITINFGIQLIVDFASVKFADKIGYKKLIVLAHICAALGLAGLGILPELFSDAYTGILLATAIYAVGGGLIEVLISPIVEACPTDKKAAAMSLLHSFYCWGHVFVVLSTTLFFYIFGIGNWRILAFIWMLVPLFNAFYFSQVPIIRLVEDGQGMPFKKLLRQNFFWIFTLLMVCSGASEQAMSQWVSAFAELELKIAKSIGDIAGPCLFATLMGISRIFYSRYSEKIKLKAFMIGSGCLCLSSYMLASFSPYPILAFAGCALCGLSVGILWPGTFSLASAECPKGGTAMFAMLALSGDLGCSLGPTVVGIISSAAGNNVRTGFLVAVIFPILLILGLYLTGKISKK